MHKILMEDDFQPSVDSQWRLNLNMKEVVDDEELKLLDTSIIYPMLDNA